MRLSANSVIAVVFVCAFLSIFVLSDIAIEGNFFRSWSWIIDMSSRGSRFIISDYTPATGSTDLSLHTSPEIRFSKTPDRSTINKNSITVIKDGESVDWNFRLIDNNLVIDIEDVYDYNTGEKRLDENSDYLVQISNKIKDLSGNRLTEGVDIIVNTKEMERAVFSDKADVLMFNERVKKKINPWYKIYNDQWNSVKVEAKKGMSENPNPWVGAIPTNNNNFYNKFWPDAIKIHSMGVVASYLKYSGETLDGKSYEDYVDRIMYYVTEWAENCKPEQTFKNCGDNGITGTWYQSNMFLHTPLFFDGIARVWDDLEENEKDVVKDFGERMLLVLAEYGENLYDTSEIQNYHLKCAKAAGYEYKDSVYNSGVNEIPLGNIPNAVTSAVISISNVIGNDLALAAASDGSIVYTPDNYCNDHSYHMFEPVFDDRGRNFCDPFKTLKSPNKNIQGHGSEEVRRGKYLLGEGADWEGYYTYQEYKNRVNSLKFLLHKGIDGFNDPIIGTNPDGLAYQECFSLLTDVLLEDIYLFDGNGQTQWPKLSKWADKQRSSAALSDSVYSFYRLSNIEDVLDNSYINSRPFKDNHFFFANSLDVLKSGDKVGNEPPHAVYDLNIDYVGSTVMHISWEYQMPTQAEGWDMKAFRFHISNNNKYLGWVPANTNEYFIDNIEPGTRNIVKIWATNYWGQKSLVNTIGAVSL